MERVFLMAETTHAGPCWTPTSEEEKQLVRRELDAMLASHPFRGSKRYPALLKHVVEATLDGRPASLKERTLGVEVFGRHPDYDTNADPVVRFSAGEVRKRIAQFYHENGHTSVVRIELPLGSYVPEFILQPAAAAESPAAPRDPALPASPARSRRRGLLAILLGTGALGAIVAIAAVFLRPSPPPVCALDGFWAPFLRQPGEVLISVGLSHPRSLAPEPPDASFLDNIKVPYHHVTMSTAIAMAHLAGILQEHGRGYEIKDAIETSLPDIRSRPLILIGATNNDWTMRLVGSLRYRFVIDGTLVQIRDSRDPGNRNWLIDVSKPFSSVPSDYAIVARFHDPTTEGPVIVVAGIGPYGTEAASEFVELPRYFDQVLRRLPPGWQNRNIEMVLRSDVIDSKPGPPVLLATDVW